MNVLRPFPKTAHRAVELQHSIGSVVSTTLCSKCSPAVVRNIRVTLYQDRTASSSRLEPAVGGGGELEVTRTLMNAIVSELKEDIPRALPTIGLLKNALKGQVLCKLHTDKWPSFNTIICEVFHPRVSEVSDLLCYSRGSGEDVLQLLLSNNLISWGRRQQIYHVESGLSEYLCENVRDPSSGRRVLASSLLAVVAHLPDCKSSEEEIPCPEGFVLGCLKAHHTPLVISQWRKFQNWTRGSSFIKSFITDFDTKALYPVDNLDTPVSWVLQYPFGRMGGLYTPECYRGNNFGTYLTGELSRSIVRNGLTPEALCEVGNSASRRIVAKLGFVEGDYNLNWLVLEE